MPFLSKNSHAQKRAKRHHPSVREEHISFGGTTILLLGAGCERLGNLVILTDLGGWFPPMQPLTPFIRMLKWTIMPKFESSQMFKEPCEKKKASIELYIVSAKEPFKSFVATSKIGTTLFSSNNLGDFFSTQKLSNLHLSTRSPHLWSHFAASFSSKAEGVVVHLRAQKEAPGLNHLANLMVFYDNKNTI